MGVSPAFSANVYGIISKASANALKQYASLPVNVLQYSRSRTLASTSGAPPPAIKALNKRY